MTSSLQSWSSEATYLISTDGRYPPYCYLILKQQDDEASVEEVQVEIIMNISWKHGFRNHRHNFTLLSLRDKYVPHHTMSIISDTPDLFPDCAYEQMF